MTVLLNLDLAGSHLLKYAQWVLEVGPIPKWSVNLFFFTDLQAKNQQKPNQTDKIVVNSVHNYERTSTPKVKIQNKFLTLD